MDYSTYLQTDGKEAAMDFVLTTMPRYLASRHRVHKMFFRKCENDIGQYETCIDNNKWKSNIDQYINASLRRKCYSEWVQVRRCAVKNIGDSFASKLNMTRQIEESVFGEEETVYRLQQLDAQKAQLIKWEKNQFGFPEEEEGEADAEEGEGEGESEGEGEGEGKSEEGESQSEESE